MSVEPQFKSLAPVLIVDEIEPCLPFWTEQLGFDLTMSVPAQVGYAFAILQRDEVEVMYQSRASLQEDLPQIAQLPSSVVLYLTVEDLDALMPKLDPAQIVVPRRRTFYGAEEVFVREPHGGHIVALSQMLSQPPEP